MKRFLIRRIRSFPRPGGAGPVALFFLLLPFSGHTQSQLPIDSVLARLASLQVQQDSFFFQGSFPAYRRYGRTDRLKEDNNIYFTGLIAFILKTMAPRLSPVQRQRCDSMVLAASAAYRHYRHPDGRPTYNFWPADPPLIFPNAPFLNLFNRSQALPDDLDDTVMLWLSLHADDSLMRQLHRLMGQHANLGPLRIRNTLKAYRDLPAYSTWFGEKMPIDFDASVLCNVLYFVFEYHLPLNGHDSASIELLRRMISRGDHLDKAAFVSPHYGRSPLLLYHIARLLGRFSVPALDTLKPRLLQDARRCMGSADNWLDSTLLSTALMRLGAPAQPVRPPEAADLTQAEKTYFVASFSAILPSFWKRLLLHSQWIKYYFVSPAFRYALYLENRILAGEEGVGSAGISFPGRVPEKTFRNLLSGT